MVTPRRLFISSFAIPIDVSEKKTEVRRVVFVVWVAKCFSKMKISCEKLTPL